MKGMQALQERVNALLRRYAAVIRERDALKKELNSLREEQVHLQSQFRQAEERLLAMQIGQSMPDDSTRAQSRKKLDAVIGEIDKILMNLDA